MDNNKIVQKSEPLLKDYFSIKKILNKIEINQNSNPESNYLNNNNLNNEQNVLMDLKNKKNYLVQQNFKLKFCMKNIKEAFDKEIKKQLNYINDQNIQIKEGQNKINKNNLLIEELKLKLENYGNRIVEFENNKNQNNDDNLLLLKEENIQLKKDIINTNKLIEKTKNEINEKNNLILEINKIKEEIENSKKIIEQINNEIEKKDNLIKELKNRNIKQNEFNTKNNEIQIIIKEIKDNKEKKEKMNKEFEDIKLKLINEKKQKEKLNALSLNTKQILNNSYEENQKLKDEYENKIKCLVNEIKENKDNNEITPNENENLSEDDNNKILFEENEKIKKDNEILIQKIKDFNNLEIKYKELLNTFSHLKEENNKLKQESANIEKNENPKIKSKIKKEENKTNQIKKNNIIYNKNIIEETNNSNINNNNPTNIIYSKKKPLQKPKNLSKDKKEMDKLIFNNEETQSDNLIDENFNLFKPIKEGLLSFNLSKKDFNLIIPENYEIFWNNFEIENSMQYNTLEGLFILNSKDNQLHYYSKKKNTFCELFYFNYDHKEGCLYLDNLSKNIIVIGGKNTTKVEKFSFEEGEMEELPDMKTHRYKMSCCQIDNKIYCFFGLSIERKEESLIEYLDMDNINKGWEEIKYINKTSFNYLTYMSCVNLNDSELLILGGLIEDNIPNQKLLYFNIQKNEFIELDKDLPDSDVKKYLFSKNIMFNLFFKKNAIFFTNIDDNNQVHILDNDLKYDLYLPPKL